MKLKEDLVECLHRELVMQKGTLEQQKIETIYFGGGTPSLLSALELQELIRIIETHYQIGENLEITLESNPDDLDLDYLKSLKNDSAINRLSIGVQSFHNEDLLKMNRAHDSKQAYTSIENALKLGFENLTIDLIFGAHTTTDEHWHENLKIASNYSIPHLSIYGLTVEPKTALDHFIKSGSYPQMDDEQFSRQFKITQDYLIAQNYEQYEVSNYAKEGHHSRHNTAYWKGIDYLGIGPASHSFLDGKRYWNISNNAGYIQSIKNQLIPQELEELSEKDRFNEYLLTGLRTADGCEIEKLESFSATFHRAFWLEANELIKKNKLDRSESHIFINRQNRIMTDAITQELFSVN